MRAGDDLRAAQRRAATGAGSVAVAAGAGTGKTHMLAHRYLFHLEQGLEPLQVVAVTFTEKAAAELRARIRSLVARAHADGASIGADALVELEAAQIGTLHALAARICRDHPHDAGVPADFAVLDQLDGQVWLAEQLEGALSTLPASVFEEMSYPLVKEALVASLRDPLEAEAALDVGPERWPELIAAARARAAAELTGTAAWRDAAAVVRGARGRDGDLAEVARAAVAAGLRQLDAGDAGPGFSAIAVVNLKGGAKAAWLDGDLAGVKEALKLLRDAAKGALKDGLVNLELGPADDRLAALLPSLRNAFRTVRDALERVKRRRRVLDFADLESHALRALEDGRVREHYALRWRAVLVDEFQDVNPVQERLLELLTTGMNLTIVGDEKQSIYGFRGADVRVFTRTRRKVVAGGGDEIAMAESFRAHAELTSIVNRCFAAVLGEQHQDLDAVRREPPHPAPFVTLHLLRADGIKAMRQVAEAHCIGRALRALLDDGTAVWDKALGALRPLRPDDIAVLTRTWEPLEAYGEILPALGVPAVHTGGGNLLDTREAKDGTALLRVVADPHDDLALVAVLRSPYFAVDDATLYGFAQALPYVEDEASRRPGRTHASWWSTLESDTAAYLARAALVPPSGSGAGHDLARAHTVLRELRSAAAQGWSPSRVLRLADQRTGYDAVLAGMPGAPRRSADHQGFVSFVGSLELGLADVFSVVRRLRRLLRAEVEVPRPRLQADGAVSLITIHGSKGLEWPVVVVADLERRPPNGRPSVLFDRELGFAVRLRDDAGERVDPALYTLLSRERGARAALEAKRLLYVALTRARDRLLLTAAGEKGGSLEVLAVGLEAAGIVPIVTEIEPSMTSYPRAPAPVAADAALAPVTLDAAALGTYAAFVDARRPQAASAAALAPGGAAVGPLDLRGRLGVAPIAREPDPGKIAADHHGSAPPNDEHVDTSWSMARLLIEAYDADWLRIVDALVGAGLRPPDVNVIGSELTSAGRLTDHQVVLGWRHGDELIAVVDAATPEGTYDSRLIRVDPAVDADAVVRDVTAALA